MTLKTRAFVFERGGGEIVEQEAESFRGSKARTSAEFALTQLAAEPACMVMENSARVSRYAANRPLEFADGGLAQPSSEYTRGDLALFDCEIARTTNGMGAVFGLDGCRVLLKSIHRAIALLTEKRKQTRIIPFLVVRSRCRTCITRTSAYVAPRKFCSVERRHS